MLKLVKPLHDFLKISSFIGYHSSTFSAENCTQLEYVVYVYKTRYEIRYPIKSKIVQILLYSILAELYTS